MKQARVLAPLSPRAVEGGEALLTGCPGGDDRERLMRSGAVRRLLRFSLGSPWNFYGELVGRGRLTGALLSAACGFGRGGPSSARSSETTSSSLPV